MFSKAKIVSAGIIILAVLIAWTFYQQVGEWREEWRRGAVTVQNSCKINVQVTEEAEKKPGGALYKGEIPKTRKDMQSMPSMEGSHHVHAALYGGEQFMSKNQINHIETVFSKKCGLRVFFYNAFTEPVSASRFQAVALLIPDGINKPFIGMVFLKSSEDGTVLQAEINYDVEKLISAELYVKYPGIHEPEMFDVYLGDVSEIGVKPQ